MRNKQYARFTLVELLVMIALVCIVMALFLPLLQGALHTARLTSCLSNQRALSLAYSMYFDEFNRFMPPAWGHQGHNIWSTQHTLVNLGIFYPLRYLDDPALVFCPAHSYSAKYFGGTSAFLRERYQSGNLLKPTISYYTTYVSRGPTDAAGMLNCKAFQNGENMVNRSYPEYDAPARISGNLPGGIFANYSGNVAVSEYASLRSPRALVMCALPIQFWGYAPTVHSRRAFNVLYVDGTAVMVKNQPGMRWMETPGTWGTKFIQADKYYPGFRRPQLVGGNEWTSYANNMDY